MILSEAISFILKSVESKPDTETILIEDSCGRILAETLKSSRNIPPFDNSQVDGYAVNSQFLPMHVPVTVSERIPAGSDPNELDRLTTARIFTGAVIPKNSDAVVMQEQVEIEGEKILFKHKIFTGQNIRKKAWFGMN